MHCGGVMDPFNHTLNHVQFVEVVYLNDGLDDLNTTIELDVICDKSNDSLKSHIVFIAAGLTGYQGVKCQIIFNI